MRAALLAADAAGHLAVLAWLVIGSRSEPPRAQASPSQLVAFDVSQSQTAETPLRPAGHPKISVSKAPVPAALAPSTTPPPLSIEQQVATIIGDRAMVALASPAGATAASVSSSMGVCDLTAPVQSALRADPAALAGALRLPRSSLSIAHAYMLWNAGWVLPRDAPAAALDAVRGVIAAQVARASIECREQVQMGPRFIVIGPRSAPLTLVIGSGMWSWGDLAPATSNDMPENVKNTSLSAI